MNIWSRVRFMLSGYEAELKPYFPLQFTPNFLFLSTGNKSFALYEGYF